VFDEPKTVASVAYKSSELINKFLEFREENIVGQSTVKKYFSAPEPKLETT
jgi:hypothetical protein